jgi:outer membrane protein OmpA-like peptidoglycan-associated protein
MTKTVAAVLFAICTATDAQANGAGDDVLTRLDAAVGQHGARLEADSAVAGPDFQRSAARPVDRSLAASDARDAIDPVDVIGFRFDSSKLDRVDEIEVREAGRWLISHPGYRLVVEAHTDAYGGDAYNIGLAARRGLAVRDELVKLGIGRDRVSVAVFGRAKPPSKDPYAAANRVVVMYATR